MPLNTNLDVAPYFDDYQVEAQANGYYRILFKPTQAVQARELTQIQSILQDQIEKFGDWAFQSGDIVYGCAVNDIPVLPFVYLQDFQSNGAAYIANNLVGLTAVNSANLQAQVLYGIQGLVGNYPNTSVVYLQYLNTGTDGSTSFGNTGNLQFTQIGNTANVQAVVNVFSNTVANTFSTGNGHGISVGDGVVFVNGEFVKIANTLIGIVKQYDTNAANNVVGILLIENIVDAAQDPNLYDNSLGYSNFNAPGADRLQLIPTLATLTANQVANTPGFNPIAIYSDGALAVSSSQDNLNSVLGSAIAERIYDESGNFVVNHFPVDTVTVTPANSIVQFPTPNTILGRIGPGVGYAGGQRVQIQKMAYVNMNRAMSTQTAVSQVITFNYGGYFIVNEAAGYFDFTNAGTVYFYDTAQQAVTNYAFTNITPSGNLIGNAAARCFTYSQGTPGTNTAQYLLHIFNVQMANGFNVNQIKSVYANDAFGVADLAQPGIVGQSNAIQLYNFGASAVANLRDTANNNNTQYTYKKYSNATMATNGSLSVTLTSSAPGGTDILPFSAGVLSQQQASQLTVIALANVDSTAITGTVTVSNAGNTVTGSGTTFLSTFAVGDQIKCNGNTTIRTITAIQNNTSLSVDQFFPTSAAAQTCVKSYLAGKIIPISNSASNTGPTGYVNVTNSTSMTLNTGQVPNTALNCTVVHDVLRTSVTPAAKTICKDRFVKIDTTTNPKGPWCLGFPDIHQLTGVWACSNNTNYSTNGINVLPYMACDSGATDTNYCPGTLHCSGFDTTTCPYLLCQLDYFTCNTTAGCGVYHCESYPVDDANTVNTTAITTSNVPCYVDTCGNKHNLRDHCDFRPVCNATANDTGTCNTANAAQVANCINNASTNPPNTVVISVPPGSGGLNPPSFGFNLEASVSYYLPRQDIIYITPSNIIQVKEGVPGTNCAPAQIPDDGMPLASIYMAPYPSLSTDQLDSLTYINKNSINVNRDTSTAVITQLSQQRRYTMRDIGKIDARLTTLENFIALNWLQQQATQTVITDSDGNPRPKTGIFCEDFSDYSACDVSNPEFACGIDTSSQVARPRILSETITVEFNANTSTHVVQTGRLITLAYTSVPFITQPTACATRSPPAKAYSWCGNMRVCPPCSTKVDTGNCGSVCVTTPNTGSCIQDFSKSPYCSLWGNWKTNANTCTPVQQQCPPPTPKPPVSTAVVNTSCLYQAMCQNQQNPPQHYIQSHQSFISSATQFATSPSPLQANCTIGVAPFGTQGDGVVKINSFPTR